MLPFHYLNICTFLPHFPEQPAGLQFISNAETSPFCFPNFPSLLSSFIFHQVNELFLQYHRTYSSYISMLLTFISFACHLSILHLFLCYVEHDTLWYLEALRILTHYVWYVMTDICKLICFWYSLINQILPNKF